MQLKIPNAAMPNVQTASASFVLQSLLNVGSGLSEPLMNIAFTMSR